MEPWHPPSSCVLLMHENQPQETEIRQLAAISATSVINITGRSLIIERGVWDSVMKELLYGTASGTLDWPGGGVFWDGGGSGEAVCRCQPLIQQTLSFTPWFSSKSWYKVSNTSLIFCEAKNFLWKHFLNSARKTTDPPQSKLLPNNVKGNGPLSYIHYTGHRYQVNSQAESSESHTGPQRNKPLTDS